MANYMNIKSSFDRVFDFFDLHKAASRAATIQSLKEIGVYLPPILQSYPLPSELVVKLGQAIDAAHTEFCNASNPSADEEAQAESQRSKDEKELAKYLTAEVLVDFIQGFLDPKSSTYSDPLSNYLSSTGSLQMLNSILKSDEESILNISKALFLSFAEGSQGQKGLDPHTLLQELKAKLGGIRTTRSKSAVLGPEVELLPSGGMLSIASGQPKKGDNFSFLVKELLDVLIETENKEVLKKTLAKTDEDKDKGKDFDIEAHSSEEIKEVLSKYISKKDDSNINLVKLFVAELRQDWPNNPSLKNFMRTTIPQYELLELRKKIEDNKQKLLESVEARVAAAPAAVDDDSPHGTGDIVYSTESDQGRGVTALLETQRNGRVQGPNEEASAAGSGLGKPEKPTGGSDSPVEQHKKPEGADDGGGGVGLHGTHLGTTSEAAASEKSQSSSQNGARLSQGLGVVAAESQSQDSEPAESKGLQEERFGNAACRGFEHGPNASSTTEKKKTDTLEALVTKETYIEGYYTQEPHASSLVPRGERVEGDPGMPTSTEVYKSRDITNSDGFHPTQPRNPSSSSRSGGWSLSFFNCGGAKPRETHGEAVSSASDTRNPYYEQPVNWEKGILENPKKISL